MYREWRHQHEHQYNQTQYITTATCNKILPCEAKKYRFYFAMLEAYSKGVAIPVCLSVCQTEISQLSLIMKYGSGIHGPQRMSPSDFGDPLTLHLVLTSSWRIQWNTDWLKPWQRYLFMDRLVPLRINYRPRILFFLLHVLCLSLRVTQIFVENIKV